METGKQHYHLIAAALAAASLVAALPESAAEQPAPGQAGFGELLIKAAKASPGCLGIETGRTTSGTLVIFAWFEDKKVWLYPSVRRDRPPGSASSSSGSRTIVLAR